MSKPKDGGPAFAGQRFVRMSNGEWKWEPWEGMSLRAWLAGMAIMGAVRSEGTAKKLAELAVEQADALIAQLEKEAK